MANIQSAKKRIRVSAAKNQRNKTIRTNLKTVIKKAQSSISANTEDRTESIAFAIKKIDQACAKGILHKNTAARKKSKLAKQLGA